jgi:peptidoglycan hydrolase-like protein with peptidoglycan-binding domain
MSSASENKPLVEISRRKKLNYGLMSIVTLAGAFSTALLWSMSANDPYWKLVEAPSVPAPAYDGAENLRAMLANAPLEFGNTDAGAVNPVDTPLATDGHTVPAEPMIVIMPPPELKSISGPAADAVIAYELPRSTVPVPTDFAANSDLVVSLAPTPLPAPAPSRDSETDMVADGISARTLDSFVIPQTPAQPRIAASEETEEALGLKRSARVNVQRRLALAGFDPRGLDGIFGPQTRGAITDFQTAWGFPATGYLEPSVYGDLKQRTEGAYQALRRQAAAAPRAAPDLAPAARERQLASADNSVPCARDSDGRIIEHQSLACDIAGFGESFVSLGRNKLDYGDDGTAANSPRVKAGVDR